MVTLQIIFNYFALYFAFIWIEFYYRPALFELYFSINQREGNYIKKVIELLNSSDKSSVSSYFKYTLANSDFAIKKLSALRALIAISFSVILNSAGLIIIFNISMNDLDALSIIVGGGSFALSIITILNRIAIVYRIYSIEQLLKQS